MTWLKQTIDKNKKASSSKNNFTFAFQKTGEVSEWSNEQAWKVCILARVSRVRIPPSPLKKLFHS